ILIHVGFLTEESGDVFSPKVLKGGPLGEMMSLQKQNKRVALGVPPGRGSCPLIGPLPFDLIYTDYHGLQQMKQHMGISFRQNSSHCAYFSTSDVCIMDIPCHEISLLKESASSTGFQTLREFSVHSDSARATPHPSFPPVHFSSTPSNTQTHTLGWVYQKKPGQSMALSIPSFEEIVGVLQDPEIGVSLSII
ncbi:hypothetical protein DNTS_033212, partial [Danionella cerebrum]